MSYKLESRVIGQTIKSLRQSRNWTQDYLSGLTYYSVRSIRRIENAGTTDIDVVNVFAEAFGVPAIDILSGDVFCLLGNNKNDYLTVVIVIVFIILIVINIIISGGIFFF